MTIEEELKKLVLGYYRQGRDLVYDKFSVKDAHLLVEALKLGKFPKSLHIDFHNVDISDEGFRVLASALASGKFPPKSCLYLCGTEIGFKGIKALVSALESGNFPEGFTLALNGDDIGYKGVQLLAKALASGQCPKGLFLDLNGNIGDKGAAEFARALETGNGPEDFRLELGYSNVGDKGAKALASALESGNCPSGYQLRIRDDGDPDCDTGIITDTGAGAFVTALASGKYRTGFGLVIDCTGISERQDEKFAEVLSSGSCPYGTEVVSNHRSYHESSRSNNNRINAEKGRALATIIGRYEGMNETKKIKDANDNVTKSCFHLFPDAFFRIIASFLPGSVTVKKVRSEIKLASETACNKVFRETIESTIRDFVTKNTLKIFNDASTSFNRRRDVPHLFFDEYLPTYGSFKLTNVSAKIIDKNEDDNNNSKDNNSNSLTL